jgi:hypothetical protein
MAELANQLCWAARTIGFDAFGWLTTLFERARVVLVWLFCVAQPPSVCILCCIIWSHHKLMDRSDHMRLVQVLLRKPSVVVPRVAVVVPPVALLPLAGSRG